MRENGSFKKKMGFTMTGNALVRDMRLSLKAKGLYLLIMSYITLDDLELTKTFLQKKCTEGAKAFESAWNELKENGYLKVHFMPGKHGWQTEYELLDEPQDGAHTFYHSSSGEITNTNLTKACADAESNAENQRTPQKGIYADGSYAEGTYAQGSYAKGGNNIILPYKTKNNTIDNTQSINQQEAAPDAVCESDGLSDGELREKVEDVFFDEKQIPVSYKNDKRMMQTAVRILSDWYELTPEHFGPQNCDFEKAVFDMLVDCLVEMASDKATQVYKGDAVSAEDVIGKINDILERDGSLYAFLDETADDYIQAASRIEIKDKRKYMRSVIWNSFQTYRVKFESDFVRTFA